MVRKFTETEGFVLDDLGLTSLWGSVGLEFVNAVEPGEKVQSDFNSRGKNQPELPYDYNEMFEKLAEMNEIGDNYRISHWGERSAETCWICGNWFLLKPELERHLFEAHGLKIQLSSGEEHRNLLGQQDRTWHGSVPIPRSNNNNTEKARKYGVMRRVQ